MDEIDRYLTEDLGKKGDITSNALFTTQQKAKAVIIAKQDCIVAGLYEAGVVFKKTGARPRLFHKDGAEVMNGEVVMKIQGPARSILKGERLALNIIGRMSGIASETEKIVRRCRHINQKVRIAATRKTTPGFRKFEKKAVVLGGGESHRFGLFDAVLIKDNHLKLVGSVSEAILRTKKAYPRRTIEIEVENETDALSAARMGVDIIMLDNLSPQDGGNIAQKIRTINPGILIEVSGGITDQNIEQYASFADRISMGYLTHSIKNKDFSLEIFKN
jgi:nicotinate-nucleotide pyrophosphorylase (carboxylating)